jgi:hypothetical protein
MKAAEASVKCRAVKVNGERCQRNHQWEGLCFQHWRIRKKGGHVATVPYWATHHAQEKATA